MFLIVCEYRLNRGSKQLYEQTTALGWIKEARVTLVHTQVLMGDYCNQGKADCSDMILH